MKSFNPNVQSKIDELSNYGYIKNFSFNDGKLFYEDESNEEKVEKHYVPQQISVEAEYLYEENGAAVIAFMTYDGVLGYTIDTADKHGEFPIINYLESFED